MNTTTRAGAGRPLASTVLATAALLICIAVLSGLNQNVNLSNRHAFWLLFLIGLALCGLGPLGEGERVGWWNPRHLLGYLLGAFALLLGAAMYFDFTLPGIHTTRAAVLALALLVVIKMGVACLYPRDIEAERRS